MLSIEDYPTGAPDRIYQHGVALGGVVFSRIKRLMLVCLSSGVLWGCGAPVTTALPATSVAPAPTDYSRPSNCKTCDVYQRRVQDRVAAPTSESGK